MVEDDWEDVFLHIFRRSLHFIFSLIHDFMKCLNQLEAFANKFLLKTKPLLPHVARLCILSTFIENAYRKWIYWDVQQEYLEETWNCGWYLATMYLYYDVFGQLISAIMIMSRKRVGAACGLLASIWVLQSVVYYIFLWDQIDVFFKISAGYVLFLLYDTTQEEHFSIIASISEIYSDDDVVDSGILLFSRILLFIRILLYLMFEIMCIIITYYSWLTFSVTFVLFLPIFIKYKTRFSTLVIALWIFGYNLWSFPWWTISTNDYMARDLIKFYFFQIISVIGGLLLFIAYGPDGMYLDDDDYIRRHDEYMIDD